MSNRNTKNQSESLFLRYWAGVKDALPVAAFFLALGASIVGAIYAFGGAQVSQAAEIQKLKEGQTALVTSIQNRSDARDKQLDEIKRNMADKQDIENVTKQIQLQREESKETRDLLFRVLESKNK